MSIIDKIKNLPLFLIYIKIKEKQMLLLNKNFNKNKVRIVLIQEKEYFVAKDIAEILEYKRPSDAITQHCRKPLNLKEILRNGDIPLHERKKLKENLTGLDVQTKLILEPDVWRLIIKSEMPEAEKIEEWIFEEVLPSIRKTGKYELENSQPNQPITTPQTFDNFDFAKEIQINREIFGFIELINSQSPINLFFLEKIYKHFQLNSPLELLGIDLNSQYFIPTELGKLLNKSAVEINKMLEAKGFQIKVNGIWQLTENGKKYAIQLDNNFSTIKWKLESLV
jgi:prophage antirepressor-like protein